MKGIYFFYQTGDTFITFSITAQVYIGKLNYGKILKSGRQVFQRNSYFFNFIIVPALGDAVKQEHKQTYSEERCQSFYNLSCMIISFPANNTDTI